jgi:dolichol-phosphate mannosyltransferase
LIPTYNEAKNIERIYRALVSQGLDLDYLFVDDNSPDGTGAIIDRLAAENPRVHAIHRPGKLGVGSAHQKGIAWAYDRGYALLLTMDADFTHSPNKVKELLAVGEAGDVVIGTRFESPGGLAGWVWYRKLLTRGAHWITLLMLGMPYDASGAFRLYHLDRIPREIFLLVRDTGYSFFWESLYVLWMNGFSVHQIPIELPPRTYGTSKMRPRDVLRGIALLASTFGRRWFNRRTLLLRQKVHPVAPLRANTPAEWDRYWVSKKEGAPGSLYDIIARLYRLYLIRRSLAHFIRRYYRPGAMLLHAGCGGGEVDDVVVGSMQVTALDISRNALSRYRKLHGSRACILHGSIDAIDAPSNAFDGIYNLGVMEHFSGEQIERILKEFARVLKPGGRIVLFWPPTYGLSVMALKMIHFVLNNLLKKGVRLHPDEPSLIRSRAQAEAYLHAAGMELHEYSFGIRDLFTHAVIVGEKPEAALEPVEKGPRISPIAIV